MKKHFFPILLIIIAVSFSSVRGAGLYMHYQSWFAPADTSGICVGAGQTFMRCASREASVVDLQVQFYPNNRASVRLGLIYPVIKLEGGFKHGFADGTLSGLLRIAGDSLNTSGLFLRGDLRIPTGSGVLYPFSFRTDGEGIYPDAGAGLEYRKRADFLEFRCSATWTLCGQKDQSALNDDYVLIALMLQAELGKKTRLGGSVYGMDINGAGYRETYLFTLARELSEGLGLVVTAGIDSGGEADRIFDTMASVSFTYRVP